MADHLTKSALAHFRERALDASDLARIVLHLENCPTCLGLWREGVEGGEGSETEELAWDSLDSLDWLRSEHLGDGEVARYVDGEMEEDEREMAGIHLRQCPRCEEDVRSFVGHRRSEPLGAKGSWWAGSRYWGLTPSRLVYGLLVAAILIVLCWWLRPVHPSTPPLVERGPTPVPTAGPPIEARPERRGSAAAEVLLALRDGEGTIKLDRRGRLTGLDEVTGEQRRWIRRVLQSGELPRPAILDGLGETEPVVRGEEQPSPEWRLLSPEAGVIEEASPTLRWEPLPLADGYYAEIVSVDTGRRMVSPFLSAATASWTPETPCRRGGIYLARIRAVLGQSELAAPERKFRILDEREWRKINDLRSQTRSHLALGLSYARAGLIFQARQELQLLAEENQDSLWLQRLLLKIRGM